MIKIGPKTIPTNIFLAPLSGCSDLAFRLVSREHGAGLCFFEMIDSECLVRKMRKCREILATNRYDRPSAAQILGSDPSVMADAARELIGIRGEIEFLDINCACPVKKVIKKKAGACLIKDLKRMERIVKAVASSISAPVTVKMRVGYDIFDEGHITDLARACESSGASCLFVHGRTARQGYSGEANYPAIRLIKSSVRIPVFGSGNIFTAPDAKKMLEETGCDGILVARGAFGNPWIFKEIEELLKDGRIPKDIKKESKKSALKKQLLYMEKFDHANNAGKIGRMRKVAIWYLKGFENAARTRNAVCHTAGYGELLEVIDSC